MGNCCIPPKPTEPTQMESREVARSMTRDTHNFTLSPGDFIKLNFRPIAKEYLFEEIIGRGSFGKVWLASHKTTFQKKAIKQIDFKIPPQDSEIDKLLKEVSILKQLDHPNIIKIYEVYKNKNRLFIVTEYCEGGELFDKIYQLKRFTENQAAKYMLDIVSALMHCHDSDIIHRDIKPENFLFDRKGEDAKLKLIDFGSSRFVNPEKRMKKLVGTCYFMAPELLAGDYDKKADVWSLGVCLYVMLCGSVPFPGNSADEIMSCIKNAPLTFTQGIWDNVSEEAKYLIRKMMEKKPELRFSIEQVFNDDWLQSRGMNRLPDRELNRDSLKRLSLFKTESKLQKSVYFFIASQFIETKAVDDLTQVFKAADKNSDGFLSSDEIIKATESVGVTVDVLQIIKNCDIDKNGLVNYTEFLAATVNQQMFYNKQNLLKVFAAFDKNGDGKIDLEELKEVMGAGNTDASIRSMIDEADINKDGMIDIDEFMNHMKAYADKVCDDNC